MAHDDKDNPTSAISVAFRSARARAHAPPQARRHAAALPHPRCDLEVGRLSFARRSSDGSRVVGGYNNVLRCFDAARPGRDCYEWTLHRRRRRRTPPDDAGIPGIASAIAHSSASPDVLAVGSYRGVGGLVDARTGAVGERRASIPHSPPTPAVSVPVFGRVAPVAWALLLGCTTPAASLTSAPTPSLTGVAPPLRAPLPPWLARRFRCRVRVGGPQRGHHAGRLQPGWVLRLLRGACGPPRGVLGREGGSSGVRAGEADGQDEPADSARHRADREAPADGGRGRVLEGV